MMPKGMKMAKPETKASKMKSAGSMMNKGYGKKK